MEVQILSNVNQVYGELYRQAFADNKLNVYAKELNIDSWIRSLDFYLVYEREEELKLAERIIDDLALESVSEAQGETEAGDINEPEC